MKRVVAAPPLSFPVFAQAVPADFQDTGIAKSTNLSFPLDVVLPRHYNLVSIDNIPVRHSSDYLIGKPACELCEGIYQ